MKFYYHTIVRFCRYFLALGALALLLLTLERMLRIMQLVVDKDQSILRLLELTSTLIPHYMAIAMPLAFVICMVIVLYQLSMSQEIIALRSLGASNFQIARPFFILALFFICLSFVVTGYIKPLGRYAYASLINQLYATEAFLLARDGIFLKKDENVFMLENIGDDRQGFGKFFAYKKTPQGVSIITASKGFNIFDADTNRSSVVLEKGKIFNLVSSSGSPLDFEEKKFSALNFNWLHTHLSSERTISEYIRGSDVIEFFIHELLQKILSYHDVTSEQQITKKDYLRYAAELGYRLQNIFVFPLLVLFVFPCVLVNPRRPRYLGMVISIGGFVFFQKSSGIMKGMVSTESYPPGLIQGGFFVIFLLISAALFLSANYTIPGFFSHRLKRYLFYRNRTANGINRQKKL